jgi:hypothetical protein
MQRSGVGEFFGEINVNSRRPLIPIAILAASIRDTVAEAHLNTARVSAGVPELTVIAHSGVDNR